MACEPLDDLSGRDRIAHTDDDRADERDEVATQADRAAEQRDEAAEWSEATAPDDGSAALTQERARAASDRTLAASDRSRARKDRNAAAHDRWRASDDRGAAHDAVNELKGLLYQAEDDEEVMVLLGQAQGMIMAARGATALEALLELSTRAATDGTDLGTAASGIVRDVREGRERGT